MKLRLFCDDVELSEIVIGDDDIINGNSLFIGREEDCHIVLDDIQVSRHHAKIYVEDNSLLIESISGSGNVIVDGVSATKYRLDPDSVISIGKYVIKFDENNSVFDRLTLERMSYEAPAVAESTVQEDLTETQMIEPITPAESLEDENKDDSTEEKLVAQIENETDEAPEEEFSTLDDDESLDEFSELNQDEVVAPVNEVEGTSFEDEELADDSAFGDEGFQDEAGFADEGFGDDEGDGTKIFSGFANYTLRVFGEYAPIDVYNIKDKETFIGRDPAKCQIVLDDPEVSMVHAVIKKSALNFSIEDLGSSNGTLMGGERINLKQLETGDEFLIGTTSFTVEVSSDLIEAEKDRLMPVDKNQEIEVEEVVEEEVDLGELEAEENENLTGKEKFKKIFQEKKKLIYGIVAILVVVMFLSEDEKPKNEAPVSKKVTKEDNDKKKQAKKKEDIKLPPDVIEKLEQNYALAIAKYDEGEYYEAKEYLDRVMSIKPDYQDSQTLSKLIQEGYDKLIKLKNEEAAEKERKARQLKIQALLEKAKTAVKKREVQVAESLFGQILKIDPENIDVPSLKIEIEAYKKEQERIKFEKERAIAERNAKVEALRPGKSLFLKGDWYKAIIELEKFLTIKDMDEDLIKEATKMLRESQVKLLRVTNPLRSKARSYKEGQDLKQAYETFGEVLKYDPSDEESLIEREKILADLRVKSRKLYREGLIAESLSSYNKAKEKFQEVLQVSPVGSEYYTKATNKLDGYLE